MPNCWWQAKHSNGESSWGINGDTGKVVDMKTYGLYESASVKVSLFLFSFVPLLSLGSVNRRSCPHTQLW